MYLKFVKSREEMNAPMTTEELLVTVDGYQTKTWKIRDSEKTSHPVKELIFITHGKRKTAHLVNYQARNLLEETWGELQGTEDEIPRPWCWDVCYVSNEHGKTIETIRP